MIEPWEARLRALKRYWDDKRGSRAMPARADLDPVEIPELLPYILLIDTAETLEEFRYRLIGTEACKGFDRDRTGARFADLPRIGCFDEVFGGYWRSFQERTPQYYHGPLASVGKGRIQFSRLTLPLSHDGNYVDMILGGIVYSKAP
jgi:hypothetical protein